MNTMLKRYFVQVDGSRVTLELTMRALEGLAMNALFCLDLQQDLQSLFLHPKTVLLKGFVHLFRTSTDKVKKSGQTENVCWLNNTESKNTGRISNVRMRYE